MLERMLYRAVLVPASTQGGFSTSVAVTQERNCCAIWLDSPAGILMLGWHHDRHRAIEEAVTMKSLPVRELLKAADGVVSALLIADDRGMVMS